MDEPSELSLSEIRKFMIENGSKVTNHALVKHFKRFLTNTETQNEARKQFKTFVNILATIKTENNEKFLILRKKYINECPSLSSSIDTSSCSSSNLSGIGIESPLSPGAVSFTTITDSPLRQPPPYKPPPDVLSLTSNVTTTTTTAAATSQQEIKENYRDCINEFQNAVDKINANSNNNNLSRGVVDNDNLQSVSVPFNNNKNFDNRDEKIVNNDKENIDCENVVNNSSSSVENDIERDNIVNVKEAARKFNRLASEEEAKVLSPSNKKKIEKISNEEKTPSEVTMAHPKAKEWVISAAKANYQELAKLAQEYPELVKLQDPTATALHWAAKHGNEDVVKLIAGTYKANVDARTNGGYTPLHIAMQFGKDNIFELLCNVYKANRDLLDWSGNKPLDYRKQQTTVSASTYSKIRERRKHSEKDLGFLRIGSLNVRVRKTTEAFSNFLGVGGGNMNNSQHYHHHHRHHHHHQPNLRHSGMTKSGTHRTHHGAGHTSRGSVPSGKNHHDFDKIHKSWGSADNIQHERNSMPPPKTRGYDNNNKNKNKSSKHTIDYNSMGYSSMPTTPNQIRAPIGILNNDNSNNQTLNDPNNVIDSDSDSACGFGSNWSVEQQQTQLSSNSEQKTPTYI